ncbi:MAG: hypothetical protein ACQRW7_11350 [Caulobacterales bacterium]|uniref:hypothetical protein n=1 Tax=Glycocaulis sp. TaxID=1969725 RepID=UPI003FA115C3
MTDIDTVEAALKAFLETALADVSMAPAGILLNDPSIDDLQEPDEGQGWLPRIALTRRETPPSEAMTGPVMAYEIDQPFILSVEVAHAGPDAASRTAAFTLAKTLMAAMSAALEADPRIGGAADWVRLTGLETHTERVNNAPNHTIQNAAISALFIASTPVGV